MLNYNNKIIYYRKYLILKNIINLKMIIMNLIFKF